MKGTDLLLKRRSAGKPWIYQEEVARRAGLPLQDVVNFENGKPALRADVEAMERAVNELVAERKAAAAAKQTEAMASG